MFVLQEWNHYTDTVLDVGIMKLKSRRNEVWQPSIFERKSDKTRDMKLIDVFVIDGLTDVAMSIFKKKNAQRVIISQERTRWFVIESYKSVK